MWSKQVKKDAREADISEITLNELRPAVGVRSQNERAMVSGRGLLPEGDQPLPSPSG